jgi:hypothetical protein
MRRSTGISANFRLLRSGLAGALVLATALSCAESVSPTEGLDGVIRVQVASVDVVVSDSAKAAQKAEFAAAFLNAPESMSANVIGPIGAVASLTGSSCNSGGAFAGYNKSKPAFAPENIPNIAPFPLKEDGYIPDSNVPLGFDFNFYGNTYNKVHVHSNGFVVFGPFSPGTNGFFSGGTIHSTSLPNNIIAFNWTDWSPQKVADGIRFETRGTAPNRRFVLQFNNVPEFGGTGKLTTQLVLSEGSNDITIYTTQMTVKNTSNFVTQGIENLIGTMSAYDSVTNPVTGKVSRRVRNFFSLSSDAVRFSPISSKDEVAPSITAPANVTVGNDPRLASAVVAVGSPVASDDCSEVTITSARSDNKALNDPYPVGETTITWTATDAAGNSASATQTVTVLDVEAPVFDASANSNIELNATSPSGAVVTFGLGVTDNVAVTSLVCEPASGSVFPNGKTEVTCVASDAALNSSTKSFSVSVIGAREQLERLIGDIKDLPLPNGTANPLMNQLKAALENEDNACKKVSDFIDMVRKKGLEKDLADELIGEATRIMGALGCGESSGAKKSLTDPAF